MVTETQQVQRTSVVLVATATNIGGMERVVCGLARQLPSCAIDVRTAFPRSDNSDELIAWCRQQGVEPEIHDAVLDAAAPHSLGRALAFRRWLRQHDPEVVNLHYGDNFVSLWDILAARSSGRRRRVVVSIHHPTPWSDTSVRKRSMTVLGALLVDRVTTFSSVTYDTLCAAPMRSARVHKIPCGIALPASRPSKSDARQALGVESHRFVFGTLARLVEHKGIDQLIEALDTDDLRDTLLLVGGEGPLRPALEEQAARCATDVRFLGRLEDVEPLFAACDVFALPSRLEGFGLVYVEAAMFGVASVATRVGGIPDAVVDGTTGVLVEVDDIPALRTALTQLRVDDDFRTLLGTQARVRATTELTEETMARRFASLFRSLVEGRGPDGPSG